MSQMHTINSVSIATTSTHWMGELPATEESSKHRMDPFALDKFN